MAARSTLTERQKPIIGGLWLAVGPAFLMSVYLYVSRVWLQDLSADIPILVAVCFAGLAGLPLLRLHLRPLQAGLFALVYLSGMAGLMVIFTLSFVCGVFGNCL